MSENKIGPADLGLLILRLALGGIMMIHGVEKLIGEKGFQGVSDTLANLDLPYPLYLAWAVLAAEIGGSALVILGAFARLGAFAIAVIMVVSILKLKLHHGFFLPQGLEYDLARLSMALCILFAGGGGFSLIVKKKKKPKK